MSSWYTSVPSMSVHCSSVLSSKQQQVVGLQQPVFIKKVKRENKYQGSGFGTQTDMVAAAGRTAPPTSIVLTSQIYDGTSWAASATSSNTFTSRSGNQGGGTTPSSAGFITGGDNGPSYSGVTEEYTGGGATTKTITTS